VPKPRCYTGGVQRSIGYTNIAVAPIGLGGMPLSIQGRPDEHTALAVIETFLTAGGNFIDTAISYCLDEHDFGHNERLIAKALRNAGRPDVIVATKGGLMRPGGRWDVDCSPNWLRYCCEQSVRDLGGPLPLYYLHTVDPAVPLADSLGELARLRDEGKITYLGLSNVNQRQLDEAVRLTPIAAVQNRCNVLDTRDFESGLVERCRQLDIAYVPYSSVGGHAGHRRLAQYPALTRIAEKHATSMYVIALAWLLAQGPHILPIPGATKIASVRSSASAVAVALDAEDLETLRSVGSRRAHART
jgi:aryl-alcohol dehydrogenase-like predicted oxidoreductase